MPAAPPPWTCPECYPPLELRSLDLNDGRAELVRMLGRKLARRPERAHMLGRLHQVTALARLFEGTIDEHIVDELVRILHSLDVIRVAFVVTPADKGEG